MATDLERLVVSLEANMKKFESELKRGAASTDRELTGIEKRFNQSNKAIAASTSNLAAQFQDIVVSLQGGQSPLTVALQQGTQISQVLGRQGAAGAVSLLGGAFSSLVNPVSLATIGIIALGGAAVKWLSSSASGVKDLDALLEEHESNIKTLTGAYGELGKSVDVSPVKESIGVAEALVRESTRAIQAEYLRLSNDAATAMSSVTADTTAMGDATGAVIESTATKFKPFKDAIDAFRTSARGGVPDVRALREAVAEIERTTADPQVKKLAIEILELTKQANVSSEALRKIEYSINALGLAASGQTEQFKNFAASLKELSKIALPKLDDRQRVLEGYNKALESASGIEERRAAASARDAALQRINDEERKKAAEDAAKEAERQANRDARRTASDQRAFQQDMDNMRKSTELLQLEFEMIGKSAQERDRARAMIQLETEARKHNQLEVEGTREKIASLADAYSQASERARMANEVMSEIRNVGSALSEAFKGAVLEGRNLDDVLKQLLNRLASRAIDSLFDKLITGFGGSLLSGVLGGGSAGGMGVGGGGTGRFYADGGMVRGPGGPRSDNINAWLSPGEYVVNAAAAKKYLPWLEAINSGKGSKLADGGLVGSRTRQGMVIPNDVARNMGGGSVTVNIQNAQQPIASRSEQAGPNGDRRIDIAFADAVVGALGESSTRRRVGLPTPVRRRG